MRARFLQVGRPRVCGEFSRDLQRKNVGDREEGRELVDLVKPFSTQVKKGQS